MMDKAMAIETYDGEDRVIAAWWSSSRFLNVFVVAADTTSSGDDQVEEDCFLEDPQRPMDVGRCQGEDETERGVNILPEQLAHLTYSGRVKAKDSCIPGGSQHFLDSNERATDREDIAQEPQRPLYLTEDGSDEPQRPLDSDCCGSGCSPCVFDLYERDLAAWRQRRDQGLALGSTRYGPSSTSACPLRPDLFTPLPLLSATPVSDTASLYRFRLPPGAVLRLPPGTHLRLREADGDGRVVTRAYTPVSPQEADGYFDVFIRRYAAGAMSACVHRWRVGHSALWSGPFGSYRPRAGDARLVLLAAGTGVAPFVRLVRETLADEESETRLTLLLAVRRLADVFPREEIAEWARQWNFTYVLFVSEGRECGDNVRYGEPVRWRRIISDDVQELVQQGGGRTRYLVCGTRSFEKDMLNYLGGAGVTEEDVFRF